MKVVARKSKMNWMARNKFPEIIGGGEIEDDTKNEKIRIDGVLVKIVNERVQYLEMIKLLQKLKRLH